MGPVRAELTWQAILDALEYLGAGALDICDVGGGTGTDAVRLALAGHRVTVLDQSPDALASLDRRARDAGVTITGILADITEAPDLPQVDLVLLHGIVEHLNDPVSALATAAQLARPTGVLSVVVPGRVAASVSRAIAGDFAAAQAIVETPLADWDLKELGPRRYLVGELRDLLEASGLTLIEVGGLRTFSDLVPSALVDSGSPARDALLELERSVRSRPEFVEHSGGLRALARLD